MTARLEAIRALPKVELHLHLETSLRLRRLAQRADLQDSPALIADPAKFAGYDRLRRMRYATRAGQVPDALYTPENIEAITFELLSEAAAHRLIYVEVRVGGRRGFQLLGAERMLEAMARAREQARAQLGIESGIIITLVRERGPEEAEQRVREAVRGRSRGVVGVDLAGDEENYPPGLFSRPLAMAREAGLGVTAHAGEFAGPSSIWTALYQLGATRIGHGIRAVEDRTLLDYLRDRGITLELCPTSNLRLGLVTSAAAHPLRALVEHGVAVTINSDDPMLLDTDISRELALAAQVLGGGDGALQRLLAAAARAAFLPEAERQTLERAVGAAAAR